MKGKEKCKALKEIRRQIARENDIPYAVSQCTYQGDCRGTCPKCEAELRYLERELALRQGMGKAVAVVGISASVCAGLTACSPADTIRDALGIGVVETAGQMPAPEGTATAEDPDIDGFIEMAPDFEQDGSSEESENQSTEEIGENGDSENQSTEEIGETGETESQGTEETQETESCEASQPEGRVYQSTEEELAGAIPAPEEVLDDILVGEIPMPVYPWDEADTELEGDIVLLPEETEASAESVGPMEEQP